MGALGRHLARLCLSAKSGCHSLAASVLRAGHRARWTTKSNLRSRLEPTCQRRLSATSGPSPLLICTPYLASNYLPLTNAHYAREAAICDPLDIFNRVGPLDVGCSKLPIGLPDPIQPAALSNGQRQVSECFGRTGCRPGRSRYWCQWYSSQSPARSMPARRTASSAAHKSVRHEQLRSRIEAQRLAVAMGERLPWDASTLS